MGRKVKITVTESCCRSRFHRKGQEFIINEDETICPPMRMELWYYAYPYVWSLLNGGKMNTPENERAAYTDVVCPD